MDNTQEHVLAIANAQAHEFAIAYAQAAFKESSAIRNTNSKAEQDVDCFLNSYILAYNKFYENQKANGKYQS